MYPLKMSPNIKEKIWGGDKMKRYYNKEYSFQKAGESWEVSVHEDGLSRIANGSLAGMTFKEAVTRYPEICGVDDYDFPLMFKIIETSSDSSIQVHPTDDYAWKNESHSRGKTEMWYIIDCDDGAKVGYGFIKPLSDEEIRAAIDNGTLENYIRYVGVKKGEAYFVPAGTVHYLGDGLLIAELQQSSNLTYRLYDYNRVKSDGKRRELHVDKALDVIDRSGSAPIVTCDNGDEISKLVDCDKFVCDKINCTESFSDSSDGEYLILFFTEGCGKICYGENSEEFKAGDTFVIPANLGDYSVSGKCGFLRCHE